MKKVYAEMGYGNGSFFSTEIEEVDESGRLLSEYRLPRFVRPGKITHLYIRIWINRKVYILSTLDGFKTQTKDKPRLKFLLGLGGVLNSNDE